ncbi:hypothetical protein SAMN05216404_1138 [Nitrosospira multiformis]|uniref:Uncharacterized protein n=1 Tax=Nitrosospira multiformis TaxID=1231 RepID=A0A1H8MK56_9PROT|nr:hypothetical protein SAMN05216404_1138 [Nitrosospira multiformis]
MEHTSQNILGQNQQADTSVIADTVERTPHRNSTANTDPAGFQDRLQTVRLKANAMGSCNWTGWAS